MSEMIERVARAISPAAFANGYSSKKVQGAEQARARILALAAIEAMREPSEGMSDKAVFAARLCVDQHEGELLISASIGERVWRAMIDAALSQSGEDSLPPRDAV